MQSEQKANLVIAVNASFIVATKKKIHKTVLAFQTNGVGSNKASAISHAHPVLLKV